MTTALNTVSQLLSIQVGRTQTHQHPEGAWTTAFYKEPVAGPIEVTQAGLTGDSQADQRHHGGVDKAVMAYSADHTSFWRTELNEDIPPGGFGENLFVGGATEDTVCIGDRWAAQDVVLEISQPRQPCWKLGRRWNRKDLVKLVVQNGKSGWYFRVLQTGEIGVGDLCLLERPNPDWSVARASQVYYDKASSDRAELASLIALAEVWKLGLKT